MASLFLSIHSKTPELRKIKRVVDALRQGAVILYPTDTGYTLGCQLSNKNAINKIRQIRKISTKKSLTFLCGSLSNIAEYAKVSNSAYRVINALIPGPFTFILPATKNVPKFASNPIRKTSGIRVPDNRLSRALFMELGEPLISITAKHGDDEYINDPEDLVHAFRNTVDLAVTTDQYNFTGESTVLNMTTDEFSLYRHGAGITKALEFVDIDE